MVNWLYIEGSASDNSCQSENFDVRVEEKEFPLGNVPVCLQYAVISKISFADFARLSQTCARFRELCSKFKRTRLIHSVSHINVNKKRVKVFGFYDFDCGRAPRINIKHLARLPVFLLPSLVTIPITLTKELCDSLCQSFNGLVGDTGMLITRQLIDCGPEDFSKLLKILAVDNLVTMQFLSSIFFKLPEIRSIRTLTCNGCGCTDTDFLQLSADMLHMRNDCLTDKGINQFLKQWKNGERRMRVIDIEFDSTAGTHDIATILEGLDANPVWTPEWHEYSVLRTLPLNDVLLDSHVYSIFRSDDINEIELIRFTDARLDIFPTRNETSFLYAYLGEDNYFWVTNECLFCAVEVCEHRRRFSIPKFARAYPKTWSVIMNCITFTNFALECCYLKNCVLEAFKL